MTPELTFQKHDSCLSDLFWTGLNQKKKSYMIFNVIIWHLIDVGQTEFIEGSVKKKKLGLSITKINVSSTS